jgi:hypothetical protein
MQAAAIVQIAGPLQTTSTALTSTLPGAPPAVWNVVKSAAETTDMIGDPDSMTLDPAGELVLDNRSDDSFYIVRAKGAPNPVAPLRLRLFVGARNHKEDRQFESPCSSDASLRTTIEVNSTRKRINSAILAVLFAVLSKSRSGVLEISLILL